MLLTAEHIKETVSTVAEAFNARSQDEKINRISLFGSYATKSASESSDVDLLIEFDSSFVSLFTFGRLLTEFEELLNVPVDIVQAPLQRGSFLSLDAVVPLYEQN